MFDIFANLPVVALANLRVRPHRRVNEINADSGFDQLIPMYRLPAICGLSRASLYRMKSAGTFPPGIKVGPARRLFPAREIRAWLADPAGYRADGS